MRLTQAEREPSPCTKKRERNNLPKSRFWEGMNYRDETDECSMKPVGRMIAYGFELMDDNDKED